MKTIFDFGPNDVEGRKAFLAEDAEPNAKQEITPISFRPKESQRTQQPNKRGAMPSKRRL
jgi:hypothetical protein